ncbi:MAG TPA: DUF5615 family PIN-like protein [Armatimonadota bacterium]|nr:DUF5615 family PIN-like protein [Armatimonadota bacterium]
MKLVFDQNLSFNLCPRLADLFPDSSQVRLVGLDRADDRTRREASPRPPGRDLDARIRPRSERT